MKNNKISGNVRNPRLDELRGLAILMVVIFHTVQRWPSSLPNLESFTKFGEYGVDLFFVLSGWLIGSVYWNEFAVNRRVSIQKFLIARASRTMAPYYFALALVYSGVRFFRDEAFDWKYLVFCQNYLEKIPYFNVSWSLCVEEHFYLALPLILFVMRRNRWLVLAGLPMVALLPTVFRYLESGQENSLTFGYYRTATHFRFDGLLIMVWASYVFINEKKLWKKLRFLSRVCVIPAFCFFILCLTFLAGWRQVTVPVAAAVFFSMLLIVFVEVEWKMPPLVLRTTYLVSITSYSVYLVHMVSIDVALRAIGRSDIRSEFLRVIVFVLTIGLFSMMFFVLIEKPTLVLRKKLLVKIA